MTSLWIPLSVDPCLQPALGYPVFSGLLLPWSLSTGAKNVPTAGSSFICQWSPVPIIITSATLINLLSENTRVWFKPNSTPLCLFISWLNKQIKDKHNTISYCFFWFSFAGPFLIVTYISLQAVFGTVLPCWGERVIVVFVLCYGNI